MAKASLTPATLKPIASHAFESHDDPFDGHPVLVGDISRGSIGLRARQPVDICSHYSIHCDDAKVDLRDHRLRIVSCRRGRDGAYDISAERVSPRLSAGWQQAA